MAEIALLAAQQAGMALPMTLKSLNRAKFLGQQQGRQPSCKRFTSQIACYLRLGLRSAVPLLLHRLRLRKCVQEANDPNLSKGLHRPKRLP